MQKKQNRVKLSMIEGLIVTIFVNKALLVKLNRYI